MFTGIITARGTIEDITRTADRLQFSIAAPFSNIVLGESIAVNGACLTVVDCREGRFIVQAIMTTRGRTTIGDWVVGQSVNLERSLAVGDRFGGHIVQGHVDAVGEVVSVVTNQDAVLVDVRVPSQIARICVLHGSIAVDGVSLTVNALSEPDIVQVALIPYTLEHTTFSTVEAGTMVHLEGDVIGKYVSRLIAAREPE